MEEVALISNSPKESFLSLPSLLPFQKGHKKYTKCDLYLSLFLCKTINVTISKFISLFLSILGVRWLNLHFVQVYNKFDDIFFIFIINGILHNINKRH